MKLGKIHICNGCKAENILEYTKPSIHTATFAKYTCANCESRFTLKVKREKRGEYDSQTLPLQFEVIHYVMSPKLRTILSNPLKKKPKNPYDRMG